MTRTPCWARQRAITKQYRVIVEGALGNVELPHAIKRPLDNRPAESVILQARFNAEDRTTTLLIDIRTGRKHQIRRHLSAIGHPVIGDRMYGSGRCDIDLQLSSVLLSFSAPHDNRARTYSLVDRPNKND